MKTKLTTVPFFIKPFNILNFLAASDKELFPFNIYFITSNLIFIENLVIKNIYPNVNSLFQ